jgi:hypothetical protein
MYCVFKQRRLEAPLDANTEQTEQVGGASALPTELGSPEGPEPCGLGASRAISCAHTPGPWEIYPAPIASGQEAKDLLCEQVDYTSPIGSVLYMLNAGGKCPAITGCGPTSEANARLIAAAPDLLEALEALRSVVEATDYRSFTELAAASINAERAINKALGK